MSKRGAIAMAILTGLGALFMLLAALRQANVLPPLNPESGKVEWPKYPAGRERIWLGCSRDGVTFWREAATDSLQGMAYRARMTPDCNVIRLEVGP